MSSMLLSSMATFKASSSFDKPIVVFWSKRAQTKSKTCYFPSQLFSKREYLNSAFCNFISIFMQREFNIGSSPYADGASIGVAIMKSIKSKNSWEYKCLHPSNE